MEQQNQSVQPQSTLPAAPPTRPRLLLVIAVAAVVATGTGIWWAVVGREDVVPLPAVATDLQADSWEVAANKAAVPRTEVTAALFGADVYVVGGFDAAGQPVDTVEMFNPETWVWSMGPALPSAVHHSAAVVFDEQLYVAGGLTGTDFAPTKDVWVLRGDAWQPGPALPEPIGAHGAAVLNDRLYIAGGNQADGASTGAVYSLGKGEASWRAEQAMPTPRNHLAVASATGKLYAIGGRDATTTIMQTVEIFDPLSGQWQTGASMPTGRSGIASAVLDGEIYIFGGESTERTFSDAESYDPVTGTWSKLPPMPAPRHGLGATVFGNSIYLFLGGPQPGLTVSSDVQVLKFYER